MTQEDSINAAGRPVLDRLAGKAKEVVGSLIADDTLVEEGALQQQKAETTKQAASLAVEAEQREAEAEVKAEQAANRVDQQRISAELAERERLEQVERARVAAEASVDRQAAQREAELDRQHALEERILDVNEADVVVDLVEDSATAAELELEATRAEAAADALGTAQRNLE